MYVDDTQLKFSFDVNSINPDLSYIKKCFDEIKTWMNINCFKLNEGKTEILDIGYYESPVQAISLNKSLTIGPVLKAKNLGFYFDHRMSIDNEISPTQKVCHIQLQNLWLKIRLDHSCVLSHLDYCNAAYGLLSEANLSKLKKATKFCYSLYIQSLWEETLGTNYTLRQEIAFSTCQI